MGLISGTPATRHFSTDWDIIRQHTGFVARIGLRSHSPLPQTDLAYGHGMGYAESSEAI